MYDNQKNGHMEITNKVEKKNILATQYTKLAGLHSDDSAP